MFSASMKRRIEGQLRKEETFNRLYDDVTIEEFTKMLEEGVVRFQYLKKDGKTLRDAIGTKYRDYIIKGSHGGDCPPKRVGYMTYFDCEVENWRVFHPDNFKGVYGKEVYTWDDFKNGDLDFVSD